MNIRCLKCKAVNPYERGREAARAITCKECGARFFPVHRDDGHVWAERALAQPAQRLGSVDTRELEVHQHQIRGILVGDAQALLSGLSFEDVIARYLEHIANQLEIQRVVLDHEDAARRHSAPTWRSASTNSIPSPLVATDGGMDNRASPAGISGAPRAKSGRSRIKR